MLHLFMGDEPWFRAKRYGVGTGLPTRWQAWAVVASYTTVLAGIGLAYSARGLSSTIAYLLFFAMTAVFFAIVHKRTEGGWKWHRSEKDD